MKTLLIVVITVWTATLHAAFIPSKQWNTNEIALLPRKTFGGFEPVLLIQEIPRQRPLGYRRFGVWQVVPLKDNDGTPRWNFNKVKTVKTRELQKFPIRHRIVVEEFDVRNGEIYIGKSRREREIPFISPE